MNIKRERPKVLIKSILLILLLLFYVYYAVIYAKLAQHTALRPVISLLQIHFRRTLPTLHKIILEEDLRQVQQEEWRKPPARRHCTSGIFYPLLRVFTQNAVFTINSECFQQNTVRTLRYPFSGTLLCENVFLAKRTVSEAQVTLLDHVVYFENHPLDFKVELTSALTNVPFPLEFA
ncbi:unnamed protein product [Schistocephalus solidus]|uniref:TNF_2 domain-containing protein n=1 Tax=Schistocephalus solidus TaxID=70667 RepID=A0A183TUH4_SCHSO|nr:unnamed protein product [Schistocephalus solidus]